MERRSSWFLLTVMALIGIAYSFSTALASSGAPEIIINDTNYNFGELSETTPLAHDFIVKNGGMSSLNIKDVQPS